MTPDARAALQRDIDWLRHLANKEVDEQGYHSWPSIFDVKYHLGAIAHRLEALLVSVADPPPSDLILVLQREGAYQQGRAEALAVELKAMKQEPETSIDIDAIKASLAAIQHERHGYQPDCELCSARNVGAARIYRQGAEWLTALLSQLHAVQQALSASHQETQTLGHDLDSAMADLRAVEHVSETLRQERNKREAWIRQLLKGRCRGPESHGGSWAAAVQCALEPLGPDPLETDNDTLRAELLALRGQLAAMKWNSPCPVCREKIPFFAERSEAQKFVENGEL